MRDWVRRGQAQNANGLTPVAKKAYAAWFERGPDAFDFTELQLEEVDGLYLALILRITNSRRDVVKGWAQGLQMARAALIRDGLDPEDALVGLKED
jgi:hypothetical protein